MGQPQDRDSPGVRPRRGDERFTHDGGQDAGATLLDFWRWSCSDLVSNVMRGVLAEYIVGLALGFTGGVRVEWDAVDLYTEDGHKVEVKSSSYLQSWAQTAPSSIRFDIKPKTSWYAATNTYAARSGAGAVQPVAEVHRDHSSG